MYDISYEICALLILFVCIWEIFGKKQFSGLQNRLFGMMVLTMTVGTLSSVVVCLFAMPELLLHVFVILSFSCQLGFSLLFALFTIGQSRSLSSLDSVFKIILCLPFVFAEAVLFATPWTEHVYYIKLYGGLALGRLSLLFYVPFVIYWTLSALCLVVYRKQIPKKNFSVMCVSIAMIVSGVSIPLVMKEAGVFGFSAVLSLMLIYFNILQPYSLVEFGLDTLNLWAMAIRLDDNVREKRFFQILVVDIHLIKSNMGLQRSHIDAIIKEVSAFLRECNKHVGVFCISRYRFGIMANHPDEYYGCIDLIQERFKEPWLADTLNLVVSANFYSISDTSFCRKIEDVMDIIDYASAHLGETKGKMVTVDTLLFDRMNNEKYLVDHIRMGLWEKKWFELNFQPIYSLSDKRFASAEVLLRFKPAERWIPPSEFIPAAERNGLMPAVDCYVMEKFISFVQKYDFHHVFPNMSMHINLSGQILSDNESFSKLLLAVDSDSIRHDRLIFEITEEKACGDILQLKYYMNILAEKGFMFALDDFGSGYSNIARALSLPFSTIKIDKGILHTSNRIFEGTLKFLLSNSSCKIIAEGVETQAQAEWVGELGVGEAQGFFYARPMPEDEFISFLNNNI